MATTQPQFDRPYSWCEMQIVKDEDWRDTVVLQRMMADGTIVDFDLSDVAILELFVRPRFDNNALILLLSTDNGGIHISADTTGEIEIIADRPTVISELPVGIWDQFLVATYLGGATEEFWRGHLIVHPGKVL